jgi:predicted AlkP superfamily pyrophosphatase or phosphodiesterase
LNEIYFICFNCIGLYAEIHGIINNDVYDPKSKQYFKMNKHKEDMPGWFETHEPIWITNQKSNLTQKHSVIIDWPGNSAKFDLNNETISSYVYRHPSNEFFNLTSFNRTIDFFVDKLSFEKTNLAFVYFSEPDMTGHKYGPDSKETELVVKELDYVLENLFNKLRKKQFLLNIDKDNFKTDLNIGKESDEFREVNLILLTDHGMENIRDRKSEFDVNRHVFLSDFIDVKHYLDIDKSSSGSFSGIY